VQPGLKVLTVTPLRASALDRPTVMLLSPALAAQYSGTESGGEAPPPLEIWITRHQRAFAVELQVHPDLPCQSLAASQPAAECTPATGTAIASRRRRNSPIAPCGEAVTVAPQSDNDSVR
jgi:hypothetical protein